MKIDKPCPCCGSNRLDFIGYKKSIVLENNPNEFRYWYCKECWYRFQGNPNTNFEMLYGEKYYKGYGADELVDYAFELEFPGKTIRNYEFIGIRRVVETFHMRANPDGREVKSLKWLDYGCGNGAFVNYLNTTSLHEADGFDIGFAAHYNDGTNAHSGIIRDTGTKEYYFFKGYTPEIDANNNVDITHASFATANINASKITAN